MTHRLDADPPPAWWMGDEAQRRRDAHVLAQRELEAQRRVARERLTIGARLDAVLGEIAAISTAPAMSISERVTGSSSSSSKPPPPAETINVSDVERIIDHQVRELEHRLDAYRGLTPARNLSKLTMEEKDRMIWDDFPGVRSEVVASNAPYLGSSARTIERARAREAERRGVTVRQVDGVVTGERKAAIAA